MDESKEWDELGAIARRLLYFSLLATALHRYACEW